MRVVLDTNVLIASLISDRSPPYLLYVAWRERQFDVLTSDEQIDEFRQVSRYPKLAQRFRPASAGRLVNELRDVALVLTGALPAVEASADPQDDFLLAIAEAGHADYLVSGDKRGLLALGHWRGTRILTARDMIEVLCLGPP